MVRYQLPKQETRVHISHKSHETMVLYKKNLRASELTSLLALVLWKPYASHNKPRSRGRGYCLRDACSETKAVMKQGEYGMSWFGVWLGTYHSRRRLAEAWRYSSSDHATPLT